MPEYVWIYDNKQGSEYVSYNKQRQYGTLQIMTTYWEIDILKTRS